MTFGYLNTGFIRDFAINFFNTFSGTYTRKILVEALFLLNELWPYLVSGIIITSLIKMLLTKKQVAGFFQARKSSSIVLAAFLGVISPLGSYVVIPMSAALFTLGTPLPVLMAFLMSSPLIDPNLFMLTAGAFGYEMAIARAISSLLIGIMAGYATLWLMTKGFLNSDTILKINDKSQVTAIMIPQNKGSFMFRFGKELFKMSKYIGKYFFLALILAAAVKILTPPALIMKVFGQDNLLSVLLSAGAGVPFYICGGAAIPVVQELAYMGLNKGAVLAFFISGPVTKISNMVLMHAAFNIRVFVIYVSIGILAAVLLGLVYNFY
ncbi:MAG: permease [Bacteroidales bacterium]|nr:permease [Bacteroidales bacterium]